MGWASRHIEKLKRGETVQFRPRGNSMTGKVNDGQLVTVAPIDDGPLPEEGDVVLCKVKGREYLHLVLAISTLCHKAMDGSLERRAHYLIGNNKGGTNGWTSQVFGRVTKVED